MKDVKPAPPTQSWRGWRILGAALLGAILAGGMAAFISARDERSKQPVFANQPGVEPPPRPLVDPMFVVDATLVGFVVGAGLGAMLAPRDR